MEVGEDLRVHFIGILIQLFFGTTSQLASLQLSKVFLQDTELGWQSKVDVIFGPSV